MNPGHVFAAMGVQGLALMVGHLTPFTRLAECHYGSGSETIMFGGYRAFPPWAIACSALGCMLVVVAPIAMFSDGRVAAALLSVLASAALTASGLWIRASLRKGGVQT